MKLATRLWLLGALLPSVVMGVAFLLAGQAFRAALESSLDRGLLAQGATESVSLFDGESGPHLHMEQSPLLEEVRPFAPHGELFDDTGALVVDFPPARREASAAQPPALEGARSEFSTREERGERLRELVVRIRDSDGRAYVLRLSASLAQLDESVRAFHLIAFSVVLGAGLALLALQTLLARRLSRRLNALSVHLERVRRGELDALPSADLGRDEVAALREVLAATTTQLKRARQVQDRLLADAAHELRTPLTLMRTTLDLALRRTRSEAELRQALEEARQEVGRLARLASGLLDMAAASRGWDTSPGDLAQLVDESAEAARAAAEERRVWIEVDAVRPAPARFNAPALRQAVDNLVANALRFAPADTAIRICLAPHARGWRIGVRDQGPGIPLAEREAVFAPFHRVDQRGGSGLGLAIASEVLRQHKGSASALSPDGPGAWVVLDLPAGTG